MVDNDESGITSCLQYSDLPASWQMVVGNFDAFKQTKNKELAPGVMITADNIQPYQ